MESFKQEKLNQSTSFLPWKKLSVDLFRAAPLYAHVSTTQRCAVPIHVGLINGNRGKRFWKPRLKIYRGVWYMKHHKLIKNESIKIGQNLVNFITHYRLFLFHSIQGCNISLLFVEWCLIVSVHFGYATVATVTATTAYGGLYYKTFTAVIYRFS